MKYTKLFSSNFQTDAHFSSRKTIVYGKLTEQIKFPRWLTPEARAQHGCTLIQKSGNLARNSAPPWGRTIFLASEKTSFAHLTATNASVNSPCAQHPPPRADPRAFAFFLPWMANSRGWGLLSCQIPRGGDEKRGQMSRPPSTLQNFLLIAQSNGSVLSILRCDFLVL